MVTCSRHYSSRHTASVIEGGEGEGVAAELFDRALTGVCAVLFQS